MKKRIVAWALLVVLASSGCSSFSEALTETLAVAQAAPTAQPVTWTQETALSDPTVMPAAAPVSVDYDQDDLDASAETGGATIIRLEGDTVAVEGPGAAAVTVRGTVVTIAAAGSYAISGALHDGQIVVSAGDEDRVVLLLSGADISNHTGAPIYVVNAKKTVITLAEGTQNTVTDGASYVLAAGADEPDAAIFSHDDLTINGSGALTVNANYNHGIVSKDDLKITGGALTVCAVNDGIRGRNSIAVKDGAVVVEAGGDALQSNNDEEPEEGYIVIEGGALTLTAGLDGIQAETSLLVSAGTLSIVSGGGSVNASDRAGWGAWGSPAGRTATETGDSAKGLKAGSAVTITGGIITIDASDDAVHSNGSLMVSGGEITMASGDDGMHADASLTIAGGAVNITKAYEGIESALIIIDNGTIYVIASDDGINVSGGNDGSALGGRPGQNMFESSSGDHLYLNGGYLYVDAGGDGLDSNSAIDMSGGVVIVNGPTSNVNGPLDYLGTFNITGGFLVAVGSAGMAQAPSASSAQNSVLLVFQSGVAAGTLLQIVDENSASLLTFEPTKVYQSVVFSSPDLEMGATYTVYAGGSAAGAGQDGLYTQGSTDGATMAGQFTVTSTVTGQGSQGGMPGRGGRQRP